MLILRIRFQNRFDSVDLKSFTGIQNELFEKLVLEPIIQNRSKVVIVSLVETIPTDES